MPERAAPVVFVQPYGQRGGAERYLELLLERLPRDLIGPVYCLQEGPLPGLLAERGYDVCVFPTSAEKLDMLRTARRLRPLLKDARVVHANGIKAALIAGVASFAMKARVIWVKHDLSWDGPLAWLAAVLSSRVIGVSQAAIATLGRPFRHRTQVIYNGVALDASEARSTDLRELIGAPCEAPVVALVGRLHEVKGHLHLIRLAPRLIAEIPEAHIVFIGGPDPSTPNYAEMLREHIAAAGLSQRVHLLGFREDATQLTRQSTLVAMPSGPDSRGMGREAFPLVALEALGMGVPVVAYADGGVPELVGRCGALVPPADTGALLSELLRLLRSPAERRRLAECGRERARSFSVDRMVEETERLYRSLGVA